MYQIIAFVPSNIVSIFLILLSPVSRYGNMFSVF